MDLSKVFVVIFGFQVFSFVAVQASTHMPNVLEPTMAPEIVNALGNKYTSEECLQLVRDEGVYWFNEGGVKKKIVTLFGADIPPCRACRIEKGSFEGFTVYNVELAKLSEDTTIIQATCGFNLIHGKCYGCIFTDDSGNQQDGEVYLKAIQPRFNITLTRKQIKRPADNYKTTAVFVTRIDDGKDVLQVKCDLPWNLDTKSFEFIDLCNQAHANGELDHVIQNVIEKLFLDKTFKTTHGVFENRIGEDLDVMFPCNYLDLDDLIPVSN